MNSKSNFLIFILVCAILICFTVQHANAQSVPNTMNYQGRLTDNSPQQNPVNGTVPMVFSIYDSISGGSLLWTETWSAVSVVNGIFNVLLGSNGTSIPSSVFTGGISRYLEIAANGETLTPRQQIGSVGFANETEKAADSDKLGGVSNSAWQRALSPNACSAGQFLSGFSQGGTPNCATPAGNSYANGTGLSLTGGNTFNVLYGITAGTAVEGNDPRLSGNVGGSGIANYLPKFTGASTVGNSTIFENGGNVGVGTQTPGAKLEVNGALKLGGVLNMNTNNITNVGTGITMEGISPDGKTLTIATIDPTANRVVTFPDTTGTVITTGNLGNISTVGVLAGLNVAGTTRIADGTQGAGKVLTSDASGWVSWQTPSAMGGSGTTNYVAKFTGAGTVGNAAIFESGGNVGIGTTSPATHLQLNTGKFRITSDDGGCGQVQIEPFSANTEASLSFAGTGTGSCGADMWNIGMNNFAIYNGSLGIGYCSSASCVRDMTIQTNGNIGVGTISPSAKLDVNGSVKIADGTQGAGKILVSDSNGLGSWKDAAPKFYYSYYAPNVYLTDSCANYSSITVPATGSGYIVVEANVQVYLYHTVGIRDLLILGIGDTTTDCGGWADRSYWDYPASLPTETTGIWYTFTVRRAFQISSGGSYTYYVNGLMGSGYSANTDHFYGSVIHATYFPQ